MKIMAIDPGNVMSAFVVMESESCKVLAHHKILNHLLLEEIENSQADRYVIERVACYGMPVGREVFDTCEWIGRFVQVISDMAKPVYYVLRADEKLYICNSSRAKDSNIRQALIDKFAMTDLKNGKGTKSAPDFFYGFAKDEWAAFAVGYTYLKKKGLTTL